MTFKLCYARLVHKITKVLQGVTVSLTKTDRDRAVIALLNTGMKPDEIKTHCESTNGLEDYAMSRIYTMQREWKATQLDRTIEDITELPVTVVEKVVEQAKHDVMTSASQSKGVVLEELDGLLTGKKGLEKLNGAFQDTVTQALLVANRHLSDPELPLKDWKMVMDTVAKAHTDIFNSTTNVHIGDNNTDNKKQSIFQNNMRA